MNYIVLMLGFKEFTACGISLTMKQLPESELQILLQDARKKGNLGIVQRLQAATPGELHPPLELVSELENQKIKIDAVATMVELSQNVGYLVPDLKRTAVGSVLIHAYEATSRFHDKSPLWEFFRHCRNAAAHGGHFNFLHGEPRRPAVWGRFIIDQSMQGTPLVADVGKPGLLAPGDPLRLLWDIEQAYPGMAKADPVAANP